MDLTDNLFIFHLRCLYVRLHLIKEVGAGAIMNLEKIAKFAIEKLKTYTL